MISFIGGIIDYALKYYKDDNFNEETDVDRDETNFWVQLHETEEERKEINRIMEEDKARIAASIIRTDAIAGIAATEEHRNLVEYSNSITPEFIDDFYRRVNDITQKTYGFSVTKWQVMPQMHLRVLVTTSRLQASYATNVVFLPVGPLTQKTADVAAEILNSLVTDAAKANPDLTFVSVYYEGYAFFHIEGRLKGG